MVLILGVFYDFCMGTRLDVFKNLQSSIFLGNLSHAQFHRKDFFFAKFYSQILLEMIKNKNSNIALISSENPATRNNLFSVKLFNTKALCWVNFFDFYIEIVINERKEFKSMFSGGCGQPCSDMRMLFEIAGGRFSMP